MTVFPHAVLACTALACVSALGQALVGPGSVPLLLPRAWSLPDLPGTADLRYKDLSGCYGAHWDAPRRARDLEQRHADLAGLFERLNATSGRMASERSSVEAEGQALVEADDRLKAIDAALAAERQALETARAQGATTQAQVAQFKARAEAFNERVIRRNSEAGALRERSEAHRARAQAFNGEVDALAPSVQDYRQRVADYRVAAEAFKNDLVRFDAGCAGERKLVK